jgi:hypothetical protein
MRDFLILLMIAYSSNAFGQETGLRKTITVPSYLLRDRAIVLDSLVMRKMMYVSFKSSLPLSKIRGGAAFGQLSHEDGLMSYDTAYLFDEAAGNLGFSLPYRIPEGPYHLDIKIINSKGKVLDTYSGDYDRSELGPYFRRSIQFWDFTTPYAHLDCRGYGNISYHFSSKKRLTGLQSLGISARMSTGNDLPGAIEVELNGIPLGDFNLPGGNAPKTPIEWGLHDDDIPPDLAIQKGENQLSFILKPGTGSSEGLRIYATRNSSDPDIEEAVPITLKLSTGMPSKQTVFTIPVWGGEGEHISSSLAIPPPEYFTQQLSGMEQLPLPLNHKDVQKGYVVFSRDFQRYVYPWTIPAEKDRVTSLHITTGQNDFEPLTFSIYPIRDLGDVRISVSDLAGTGGNMIPSQDIQIHVVKTMKKRSGSGGEYQLVPRLLDRANHTYIPMGYSTRFWLTLHADSTTLPGIYSGFIRMNAEKEDSSTIPLTVEVLPVRLEPVPGIEYSMCMSYEFFELESKDWTAREREEIYRDGVDIFRDYKNHGMSTVCVASPFYFQWNKDGTPPMEHFKAMIRGAKELGFTNPVYWYFGHYIQTAKGQHPGNVRLYDPRVHLKRARFLVETALELNQQLDGPPLFFMPIDEPRIASRKKIALEVFQEIKKVPGATIMSTTDIGGKNLDIEYNSERLSKPLPPGEKKRGWDRKVCEYNNTAIQSLNPAYSRYIYGYYTWRQDLDGMSSWGPGTTQNSRGDPFEDLDNPFSDWFIFFPHPGGPLPTPNWEALREGIDDIRFIYQLEKLCRQKSEEHPEEVAMAEQFLDDIRGMCDFDDREIAEDFGDWTPERFDSIRKQVVSWIIKLNP